jgi:hypothetical protein
VQEWPARVKLRRTCTTFPVARGRHDTSSPKFLPLAAAAALPASSIIARAEGYPTRPVLIIVPFAAGGASDVAGRSSHRS